jgi:hypothetical protein
MDNESDPTASIASTPFETHIHKILESIARSPFGVAPEKKEKLLEIQKKHSATLNIQDGNETEFRFEAIFGQIFTSIRSLQHIWAAACFFASLYCERQKASARGESEIQITWNEDIEVVRVLYEMSCKAFKESKPMMWPPDIKLVTPNSEYLELADEIFLLMCSFAILHEIAHFELGHHKVCEVGVSDSPKADEHETELEADKWAYDWILSSWKAYGDDPRIFTKRAMGVIFALAMTDEFRFLAKNDSFSTHPKAVERLIQFHNDYEKEIEKNGASGTCFSAISLGLQMIAFNNKALLPKGPYNGIRGFLEEVKALQAAPSA